MTTRTIGFALAASLFFAVPIAGAQTTDELIANPGALKAELDRCESLGLASENDTRCRTANEAERKRFFGSGKSQYTPVPVRVFPNEPEPVTKPTQPIGKPPND
jgi:conjugative transfer region protein TrbK